MTEKIALLAVVFVFALFSIVALGYTQDHLASVGKLADSTQAIIEVGSSA
jgi:hypothetical protein